ncbi:MAG: hypothetical protein ACRDWA_13270 [Acidimicrobiia bacterium]
MSRRLRMGIGATLAAVGLVGAVVLGPAASVAAQPGSDATLETMNQMKDLMHGPGTADRMRAIPGAEEMMTQCGAMMAASGGMMAPQR